MKLQEAFKKNAYFIVNFLSIHQVKLCQIKEQSRYKNE